MGASSKHPNELGILLVDHGSRVESANTSLADLAERVAAGGKYLAVRHAHMELASPTVADAFADLVALGAQHVIVVPYFLALGRHASEDIPHLAKQAAAAHPQVSWQLADHVGSSPTMTDIIDERIGAASRTD